MTPRSLTDAESRLLARFRTTLTHLPQPAVHNTKESDALVGFLAAATSPVTETARSIGPTWKTPELVSWLGISRQGVNKGIHERRILGVRCGRTWYYPIWQLGNHQILPAASRLFKEFLPPEATLDDLHAFATWAWTSTPADSQLAGVSPATWIQQNRDYPTVATYAKQSWHLPD